MNNKKIIQSSKTKINLINCKLDFEYNLYCQQYDYCEQYDYFNIICTEYKIITKTLINANFSEFKKIKRVNLNSEKLLISIIK